MGEILGIGLSHYPPLSGRDEDMAQILRWTLEDPGIPEEHKRTENWPAAMREEWGDDKGVASAKLHRQALVESFSTVRRALDDFAPDAVLIWGDDQYENFREDIIPPYAVLAYQDMVVEPWRTAQESSNMVGKPNAWGESIDTSVVIRGRPDIAKFLISGLFEQDFPVPYSYIPLHHPSLPHAFLNAILYLDYERRGFKYPVVPFSVNCYGRRVVSYKGFISRFGEQRDLDPPSPSPSHLMKLGAAVARVLRDSPWRVALVASSSWSHAFLCDKTWRLRPDTDSDRRLYSALVAGEVDDWRSVSLQEVEEAGQQELLNWFCLVGAMAELGRPAPSWSTFVQTDVFNSNKVFCLFGGGVS